MAEIEPNIGILWELSKLESKVCLNPTAAGFRELARRYAEEGWKDDAARITLRAEELALQEPAAGASAPAATPAAESPTVYAGAFNPRIYVELLRILHLTGKSGDLRLTAPGDTRACVTFRDGDIAEAEGADAAPGEPALLRVLGLPGGRFEFVPRKVAKKGAGALNDTAAAIKRLAAALA